MSSSVCRKHRAISVLYSSFFVPKIRNTYGCEMPALRAMSSVEAPWRPNSAKTGSAASRISSRRSSFDLRSVTDMDERLVTTYCLVKCCRHPVEIALGEPGVERQRQGPLEDAGGAGEVALVAVGAEEVQRVGADLHL